MTQAYGIHAEDLRVEKDKTVILDGLNFSVQPGSVTGLIGPSGSGKTTLMRTIVGVQKMTSGMLTVLGQPASDSRLRHKIGYVTQNAAVYDDLTVRQNLSYFAVLTSAGRGQVDQIIERVGLTEQRDRLVARLSGGQRARVSLAAALLGDPELLVMDEPTVGLDPLLRQELWQQFTDLAAQGKALLVSSHVMDEAERCEELLLLRDGQLLWHDSRQSLLKHTETASVQDAFITMIKETK